METKLPLKFASLARAKLLSEQIVRANQDQFAFYSGFLSDKFGEDELRKITNIKIVGEELVVSFQDAAEPQAEVPTPAPETSNG